MDAKLRKGFLKQQNSDRLVNVTDRKLCFWACLQEQMAPLEGHPELSTSARLKVRLETDVLKQGGKADCHARKKQKGLTRYF